MKLVLPLFCIAFGIFAAGAFTGRYAADHWTKKEALKAGAAKYIEDPNTKVKTFIWLRSVPEEETKK